MGTSGDDQRPDQPRGSALSARELEVVALVVEGLTNAGIAERLHLSHRTAQAHVARAMDKLGARSRTQLAVQALRRGLVALHPEPPPAPPADEDG